MANTPILSIPQVAPAQNNKETTINDGVSILERSLNDTLAVDFSAGDLTLTDIDMTRHGVLVGTGQTGPVVLTIPANKRIFHVKNDGGHPITVNTAAGVSSVVDSNYRATLFCDGTDTHYIAQAVQPATLFYDLGFQFGGFPPADEEQTFVAVRPFTLAAGAPLSRAVADAVPTANTSFKIQKNGVDVGTIDWAAGSLTATFDLPTPQSFVAGDILGIKGPSIPDSTIRDLAITLACTR